MPVGARDDVAAVGAARRGPRLDLVDRGAQDPLLDGLPLAVQLFELEREPARLLAIVAQEQLERRLRPAEPPRRVDARRESKADRTFVARRRIDARHAHQRAQPGLLRLSEAAQPAQRERAVLVDERDDVGDSREGDDVEVPV